MQGRIFDIQRFSVHDGPGIRTTVFMKGCPLRCRWCHNPEGLSGERQLQFFEAECLSCGACGERSRLSDAEKCPVGALRICGRDVDADEILDAVLRDRIFYGARGGVTFSGGECLLQADFVTTVLKKLKEQGVHTAIDTCGRVAWSEIEKTLDVCDLYLYDVKCVTPHLHRAYTGVDNSLILENLQRLSRTGKEIWVRVPVIPEFNDNVEEMSAIAALLRGLSGVKQVTLMPYHSLGASKYPTLGMTYPYDAALQVPGEALDTYRSIFKEERITVQ